METIGKLNSEVKKVLEEACVRVGYEPSEEGFVNFLLDSNRVYSGIGSKHRWYDEMVIVVSVGETLLMYDWYHVTGDESASDMGLEFDLSSVQFCEAYQITETRYRPIATA